MYADAMLRAAIFDVDGVLVDSYSAHYHSWCELAAESELSITEEQFAETFGRTSRDIIRRFWGADATDSSRVRELDDRKEALYREIVSAEFPAMDGAADLIDTLDDEGILLAVGSSGPPENVALVLEQLERQQRIAAVVTGTDVTRGKPDPQVFVIAARKLGVPPDSCVVVEDAPDGIRAAHAAGMAAVALVSTGRARDDFIDVVPELIVESLRDLTPDLLRALR
jgi:beta-phosphoglucomutase